MSTTRNQPKTRSQGGKRNRNAQAAALGGSRQDQLSSMQFCLDTAMRQIGFVEAELAGQKALLDAAREQLKTFEENTPQDRDSMPTP